MIIAKLFKPYHCLDSHLNAPEHQTDQTSASQRSAHLLLITLSGADDPQRLPETYNPLKKKKKTSGA